MFASKEGKRSVMGLFKMCQSCSSLSNEVFGNLCGHQAVHFKGGDSLS